MVASKYSGPMEQPDKEGKQHNRATDALKNKIDHLTKNLTEFSHNSHEIALTGHDIAKLSSITSF